MENSLESKLSILLCILAVCVPFLWYEGSLTAPVIYKQLVIETASMLFAVFCCFWYFSKRHVFTLRLPIIAWPVIGFHIMAMLSVIWAVDAGVSMVQLIHMIGLFVLFSLVVFTTYMLPDKFPMVLVRVSVASAAVLSLLGLLQNFGYLAGFFYQASAPAGTMVNKNVLAQYLDTVLFPALLMILWSKNRRELCLSAIAFSLLLTMVLVTYTRGAWLGAIVGLVVFLVFLISHAQVKKDCLADAMLKCKYMAIAIAVMVALFVMSLPSAVNHESFQRKIFDAIEQPEGGSSSLRQAMYINSWRIFVSHPFGIGIGNWRNVYPEYHQAIRKTPGYGVNMQPRNLHNDPYRFLIETGIIGGLFFLAILVLIIWSVWKMLSCMIYSRKQRLLLLSLFLSLMGVGVHSLVSFPFDSPASGMQIWLWIGVIAGLSLCNKEQGVDRCLPVWSIRLKRMHAGFLLLILLPGLLLMVWYQYASLQASELEKEAYTLFQGGKCAESLSYIDASVQVFPYAYTATMRRSMYHMACDTDRTNAFNISLELLQREPYYLNLLIYILPSALENERLDVVSDVAARLVRVFPDLPEGYHWQGMLAGGQGYYERARKLFIQALEKDSDFQPSKEMLEKLDKI